MAKGGEKSQKNSSGSSSSQPTHVQTIVVGSSLAGIRAAVDLQKQNPALQILVLESEDRASGRAFSGLHLVPDSYARKWGLQVLPQELKTLRVRWERHWVDPDQVDWGHREWVAALPQWKLYTEAGLKILEGAEESAVAVAVKNKCPVRSLRRLSDSQSPLWELTTPTSVYLADQVIWAAGLMAFQNAFGKHESQIYLDANPDYSQISADFRAGLALDWEFSADVEFEPNFPKESLWAIPVRHEGELFLLLGVVVQKESVGKVELRTFMNIDNDSLSDPKIISALQKAIKRSLKNVIVTGYEGREKWVASNRILGAELGIPWVFGKSRADGLEFVGEETLAARNSKQFGLVAAFESTVELLKVSSRADAATANILTENSQESEIQPQDG
jgi:hypothetical protein